MPNYKKKKHNKIFYTNNSHHAKPKRKKMPSADIEMAPANKSKKSAPKNNMKILKGKKLEHKRKLKIWALIFAVLIIAVSIFQIVLPGGIAENLSNTISLLGSGGYPLELDSTATLNSVSKGSYYYVLSNTHISAFSNSGKELFSHPHGFAKPVLKVSSTRALVFNQGSTEFLIFNLRGLKESLQSEKEIITANISDSGVYALATVSEKYASAVTVYSKRGKVLYEWFSAEDTVNDVVISPNGKKLAVARFNSNIGKFKSTVSVLNFKSATSEYTESFENTLIYNLDSSLRFGFSLATAKEIKFIRWSNFKTKSYKNDYTVSMFRSCKNGYVAVFNREGDKTDNRIAVFGANGKFKFEFQFKGIITDIEISGSNIYCMSDTDIYLFDKEGKVIRSASCGFGAVRFAIIGGNSTAVITDNKIEKIKLEQE